MIGSPKWNRPIIFRMCIFVALAPTNPQRMLNVYPNHFEYSLIYGLAS